ncbi:hypothetical protein A2U01_0019806, partial [Trifolium medium]|nr:hypothetical protein [Trifolium medium]
MHAKTIPNTSYKFNVQKHKQWAITVHIFLQGNSKDDYITSEAKFQQKIWNAAKGRPTQMWTTLQPYLRSKAYLYMELD